MNLATNAASSVERLLLIRPLSHLTRPIAPALGTLIAFIAYFAALMPDLTWQNYGSDGAELITASATLGIPHPPGYPTYVILGKLFSLIPLGPSLAYRYNLFSAVCMSVATGFLIAAVQNHLSSNKLDLRIRNLTAIIVGLSFAFIPLVWRQAIMAEVYALNLCLVAITLWLTSRPTQKRKPIVIGFFFGLSLTTHLTSLLLIPLVFSQVSYKQWHKIFLGILIGLLPFLVLPFLAFSGSPVIWGNPTSLEGWWWLVSAKLYQSNLNYPTFLSKIWPELVLPFVGLLLLTITALTVSKFRREILRMLSFPVEVMLSLTAGAFFIFAALYNTDDYVLFLLPSFLLLAVLISKIAVRLGPILLILPLILLMINLPLNNPEKISSPRNEAVDALVNAPEGALVISNGEETTFTLWYLQFVEGRRDDLILVDKDLFQFHWYRARLEKRFMGLNALDADDLKLFISENSETFDICSINLTDQLPLRCSEGYG